MLAAVWRSFAGKEAERWNSPAVGDSQGQGSLALPGMRGGKLAYWRLRLSSSGDSAHWPLAGLGAALWGWGFLPVALEVPDWPVALVFPPFLFLCVSPCTRAKAARSASGSCQADKRTRCRGDGSGLISCEAWEPVAQMVGWLWGQQIRKKKRNSPELI